MSDKWYYVDAGERKGPVDESVIQTLISSDDLQEEDYVWRKGFENWVKIKEVGEFELASDIEEEAESVDIAEVTEDEDAGTVESLYECSEIVKALEKRTGKKIGCIEEICYNLGYIDKDQLNKLGLDLKSSDYGKYILKHKI